jgi:outer membrane protein OmpA-like peptidoglycan-associated protein
MENVMEMVRAPWMGEVFGKIGEELHESPEGVKRVFEGAVPVSMAGLAEQASTNEGAQQLLSTFKGGQYPHLDATELGLTVADPAAVAGVTQSGESFLSRLFGKRLGGIVDGLARAAGVSAASASKLLGLALPMVLGFVGKQAVSQNLDAGGLRAFLTSQREEIGGVARGPAILREADVPRPRPRMAGWLLLALAAVALVALALWRRGSGHQHTAARRVTSTQLPNMAAPKALYAGNMAPLTRTLSGGQTLPQRFTLSELTFRTGSSEIDPAGARVLDGVADVMAAHPGARIRVEGYGAESTRAYLTSKGIAAERIEAASNEIRRMEIVVLQR